MEKKTESIIWNNNGKILHLNFSLHLTRRIDVSEFFRDIRSCIINKMPISISFVASDKSIRKFQEELHTFAFSLARKIRNGVRVSRG